jgi:hypothetical protein
VRGRFWTDAERAEVSRRRQAGEQWHVIGASYGASGDATRRAARSSVKEPLLTPEPSKGSPSPPQIVFPEIHTSKSRSENYLIISDLQIPYHHPGALEFCKRVRVEFGVPLENVLCVGDEFDFYWMSRFEKAVSAPHTAEQEVEAARTEIDRWKAAFPFLRVATSNHVKGRMDAAASRAGLASAFIREVREVFHLPETWRWADHWIIEGSKCRFRIEHGNIGPGGHAGLRNRPLNRMISTAWGHEHAEPSIIHLNTHGGGQLWGMRTGSLLTTEPVAAFAYNAEQGSRPVGSVGVVLDGGRLPLIVRI